MCRFRQLDGLRFWVLFGQIILSVVLWLVPDTSVLAQEPLSGTVTGTEEAGFGRAIFNFPEPVSATARTAGGVMIVTFDRPIRLNPEKLTAMLPRYVAAVRVDPDQRSLRFAITRPLKADMKDAAEALYLDMLPETWRGAPPPLPASVVKDLARRARVVGDAVRDAETRKVKPVLRAVGMQLAESDTRTRLLFDLPPEVGAMVSSDGPRLRIMFTGKVDLPEALARSVLAGIGKDIQIVPDETGLTLAFTGPASAYEADRDGDSYVVDFLKTPKIAAPSQPGVAVAVPDAPVKLAPDILPKPDETALHSPQSARPAADDPKTAALPFVKPDPANAAPGDTARPAALPGTAASPQHVWATLSLQGKGVRLALRPKAPAAVFEHGDDVFVVLNGVKSIELPVLSASDAALAGSIIESRIEGGSMLRLTPVARGLLSVSEAQDGWIIDVADQVTGPVEPVRWSRTSGPDGRRVLRGAMPKSGQPIAIDDPVTNEKLIVVPMTGAPYAVVKAQNFVEFRLPRTALGLVIVPRADDLFVRADLDSILIGRESGLSLSADGAGPGPSTARSGQEASLFPEHWNDDRRGSIRDGGRALLRAAADAPRRDRTSARIRLAQFHLANGFASEAHGVLGLAAAEDPVVAGSKQLIMLRLMAAVFMADFAEAGRLVSNPVLAMENEAGLWRALIDEHARRFGPALTGFRRFGDVLERYPDSLQALFRSAAVEAALEGGDTFLANHHLGALERVDADDRDPGLVPLLQGRIAEASGRHSEAIAAYQLAAKTGQRPVEAQARLNAALLLLQEKKMDPEQVKAELETIAMIWRRGEIEVRARAKLGEIYAAESLWREAFNMNKRALEIQPDHPFTRKLQDDTAQRFEALFLGGKAESLSRIEALSIFDEFRALIPVGPRGDEIVRRLAERLYELDLLDQAAELLAYQVNHRLKGLARAQVATRLAVIHLVNGKPQETLQALKFSRLANLPPEMRRARVLLEARTLAELSRTELAMEVLAAETGSDVERLRADILWRGKRWREAAETYERALGQRWQDNEPLNDGERGDIVRAGVAYVLASDRLGTDRLRAKYLPKMSDSVDAETFKLITIDNLLRAPEFREIARSVVSAETLSGFLEAYRKRYPSEAGIRRAEKAPGAG